MFLTVPVKVHFETIPRPVVDVVVDEVVAEIKLQGLFAILEEEKPLWYY